MSSFTCLFSVKSWLILIKLNVRITVVISPMNTYWSSSALLWFSINHVLVSNLIIRIFEELFVTSSLNQHLHYMFGSFTSHLLRQIIGDYRATNWYFDHLCQYMLYKISSIDITSIRVSLYKYQHLQQIAIFAQFESLIKIKLFLIHILTTLYEQI